MARHLTGLKIRTLRRREGVTQGELARRIGISASYLNLIELNKRPVTAALLGRLAAALGVEPALLDGEAERRIVGAIDEIAADAALSGGPHPGSAEELVGRHPGWADLLLRLYRAYLDRDQAVLALADRLNRDPFLGDSVHRMLTNVTSIRSAAEILAAGDAIDADARARFLAIVASDSERLAGTAKSLADFFDSAQVRVRSATPTEHVDAFLFETDNHFPALEARASEFLAGMDGGEPLEAAARSFVGEAAPAGTSALETAETRRFQLMRRVARRLFAAEIGSLLDHPALGSEEAKALAREALVAYAAAAILMPYGPFLEAAEGCRYDIDILSRSFGVSYEQAAHRLVTLRRPGAEGVRFAFMRSDPSGYVTKRLPLPRLPLPRYGNACPLWVVYGAFQLPGVTARAFGELPSGESFLFFARAIEKRPPAAHRPRHLLSIMLACTALDAPRVVYGDGIDPARATVPVGTVCRLCPRSGCGHRQEPQLVAPRSLDEKPMGRVGQPV